jgi:hypothetical protein
MIIIDTNIISELQKPAPDKKVISWLDRQEPTNLYLTAITAAELMFGAYSVPKGRRATELQDAVAHIIEDQFRGRILPFDATAAYYYGIRMAACRESGLAVGIADGQIAAIAVANNRAAIATRDVSPFQAFRLDVINPFEAQ